jgi:hypothetical protein
MADKVIRLKDASGEVCVALSVEPGPRSRCRFKLWDEDGRNPSLAGACDAAIDVKARWRLGTGAELSGWTLTWSVRLVPRDRSAAARYQVAIRILADEEPAPGGEFHYSGPLDELEELSDLVHFQLLP